MIEIRGACKTFNPGTPDARTALDGVTAELAPGEFAVVIGSNGAGKSTLLDAIAGVTPLDEGLVTIGGRDVTGLPVHRRAAHLARVFQDPLAGAFAGMTVEENLLVASLRGKSAGFAWGITEARRSEWRTALSVFRLGLEDRLSAEAGQLSGGQRQSLALAMAVMAKSPALLLDEHTAALDPRTARLVMDATAAIVARFSMTTLMVTHNMRHAIEYGSRLLMMDQGRIVRDFSGAEKKALTVETLIAAFESADDKLLLAKN